MTGKLGNFKVKISSLLLHIICVIERKSSILDEILDFQNKRTSCSEQTRAKKCSVRLVTHNKISQHLYNVYLVFNLH